MKYWSLAILTVAGASALTSVIVFSRLHDVTLPLSVEICVMSGLFLILALFFFICILTVVMVILWVYFAWEFYYVTRKNRTVDYSKSPPGTAYTSCNPSPNPRYAVKILKLFENDRTKSFDEISETALKFEVNNEVDDLATKRGTTENNYISVKEDDDIASTDTSDTRAESQENGDSETSI